MEANRPVALSIKIPAGAPAPRRSPSRFRPCARIWRRSLIYWSGLWMVCVISGTQQSSAQRGQTFVEKYSSSPVAAALPIKARSTGGLKCPSRCPTTAGSDYSHSTTAHQSAPQVNVANKLACLGLAVNDLLVPRTLSRQTATLYEGDREQA